MDHGIEEPNAEDDGCPTWCDHLEHGLAKLNGNDPMEADHSAMVATMGFVQVVISKPSASLDPAVVTIKEKTTRVFGLKSHEARTLGAWLVKAADRLVKAADLIDYEQYG